jgi:hypothetical protein
LIIYLRQRHQFPRIGFAIAVGVFPNAEFAKLGIF